MTFDKTRLLESFRDFHHGGLDYQCRTLRHAVETLVKEVARLREIVHLPIKTCPKCAGLGCICKDTGKPAVSLNMAGLEPCPVCHGSRVVDA